MHRVQLISLLIVTFNIFAHSQTKNDSANYDTFLSLKAGYHTSTIFDTEIGADIAVDAGAEFRMEHDWYIGVNLDYWHTKYYLISFEPENPNLFRVYNNYGITSEFK